VDLARKTTNRYPAKYTKHQIKQSLFRIDKDQNVVNLDDDTVNLKKVERWIKDSIIKRRIVDYAVILDTKNKIMILQRNHGERLGIYHCRHCAMTFENEIQLSAQECIFLCESCQGVRKCDNRPRRLGKNSQDDL